MKKYINPTAKVVKINNQCILAGSDPTAPGIDQNATNEGESRSKGIWGSLDD